MRVGAIGAAAAAAVAGVAAKLGDGIDVLAGVSRGVRMPAGASKPRQRKAPEPVIHERRQPLELARHARVVRLQQLAGLEHRWWSEHIAARLPRVDTSDEDTLIRLAFEFEARRRDRDAGIPLAPARTTAPARKKRKTWKPVDRKADAIALKQRRKAIIGGKLAGRRLKFTGGLRGPVPVGPGLTRPLTANERRYFFKANVKPNSSRLRPNRITTPVLNQANKET